MAKRTWTKDQLLAITARGETLLLSAAAGSGKTATLTERVLRRILDENDSAQINSLLIVTFTKAAAAELSSRIGAALTSEIAAHPENKALKRQLALLPLAKISTISSFCLELVKENTAALAIPATFGILDEAEHQLLQKQCMSQLLADLFSGKEPFEGAGLSFAEFCDAFDQVKNQNALDKTFLHAFAKVQNLPGRHAVLLRQSEALAAMTMERFFETEPGDFLKSEMRMALRNALQEHRRLAEQLAEDAAYAAAYLPAAQEDIAHLELLLHALDKSDTAQIRALLCAEHAKLKSVRAQNALPVGEAFKTARKELFAYEKKLFERFFSMEEAEFAAAARKTSQLFFGLWQLLSLFEGRLLALKYTKREYGFSDLEQFALRLLTDEKSGAPTSLAETLKKQFTEIYIDEYQDVSPLQDAIFKAIAREDNRFMVGDIKQSIYAFRGATPELFLQVRAALSEENAGGRVIYLSQNFRSDPPILAFANTVFETLFPAVCPKIPYQERDRLIPRDFPKEQTFLQSCPEIALFSAEKEGGGEEAEESERADREASYVASKIAQLLQSGTLVSGERIRPRDIAVLLRSDKSASAAYEKALLSHGVACYNQAAGNFFENSEILLLLSLLHTINNPYEEIYLCAVLKSPLFDFSLDELIYIRKGAEQIPFLAALERFTEETGFQKGKNFLEKLAQYCSKAISLAADELIWFLFCDTGLLSMVYEKDTEPLPGETVPDPEQMRANLLLFYEYARRFEAKQFHGLAVFLRYITAMIEEKQRMPKAVLSSENADVVRILSMHQSKGLEYPVCFLCGMGKQFNTEDTKPSLIYAREFGFGMKLRDESGYFTYSTPLREAVAQRILQSLREEEARILYVALTRAREQLYLTATVKDAQALTPLPQQQCARALQKDNTMIGWIVHALPQAQGQLYTLLCDPEPAAAQPRKKEKAEEKPLLYYKKEIEKRLSFVYPYRAQTHLPAKLAASELYPGIIEEETDALVLSHAEPVTEQKPKFMQSAAEATGTQRGTATHVFLQFCEFASLRDNGFDAERERLLQNGFLTPEDAALIHRDWVQSFANSALFSQILASKAVFREKRFHVMLPLCALTAENRAQQGEVLVQGVVDCFFEAEDGTITVVDYKTDRILSGETRQAFCERMLARYASQLSYYRLACARMTGKRVSAVLLYAFALADTIEIPIKEEEHDFTSDAQ